MEKPLSFKFYEETSYEDAGPYLSENILITCDGCGGAGGFLHRVDPHKIDSFQKIKKLILPDEVDESSDEFLKEYFSPIYENPEKDRTSAFWASRIALARYIYFLNDEDFEYDRAGEYVSKGLNAVKEELELKVPASVGSKTLLPTTLVSIALLNADKKRFDAEVSWAGDSRAYLLTENGLRQLTIDDEDETGAITNFFTAKDDYHTVMHHKLYKNLEKRCALFVCSDGLFDNYSDLDFEYLLLALMNEANSIEEYRDKLAEFYNKRKSDDCTMAFTALGFEDYEDMKNHFSSRNEYISELHAQYLKYRDYLMLKQKPELFDDYYNKIVSRTNDKKRDILEAIASEYKEKGASSFINDELVVKIKEKSDALLKEAQIAYEEKKKENLLAIKNLLAEAPAMVGVEKLFREEVFEDESKPLYQELKALQDKLMEAQWEIDFFEKEKGQFATVCDTILSVINRLFDALDNAGVCAKEDLCKKYYDFKEELLQGRCSRESLKQLIDLTADLNHNPDFKEQYFKFEKYELRANKAMMCQDFIDKNKPEFARILDQLFENIDDVYANMDECPYSGLIFTLLDEIREMEAKTHTSLAIDTKMILEYLMEEGAEAIVNQRLKLGLNPTCIDRFYNPSLLKNLIALYEANNGGSEEFHDFFEKYQKFNEEIMSLVIAD